MGFQLSSSGYLVRADVTLLDCRITQRQYRNGPVSGNANNSRILCSSLVHF